MNEIYKEFADVLGYQAHSLLEKADEFPERKVENLAAEKEVSILEAQFRSGDVDEQLVLKAHALVGESVNCSGHARDIYDVALRYIGIDQHYESANHFLQELIDKIGHDPIEQFD